MDSTERDRLELELRQRVQQAEEAEQRMRSVVNHVIDGIITIDERGTVTTFNPAAEKLFGYTEAEVVGQNVKLLMPEPFHGQHDGYLANYLRTGEAKIIGIGREVVGRRKDASTFPMDLAVSAFHIGQRRYFTGIVRDITDRKRAESQLHETADELARSNLDLEQFAYVASHDLQEPLRAVAGCVQVLRKRYQGQLDARADELIAHTVDGVGRMQTLIDDLLAFSRVDGGHAVQRPPEPDTHRRPARLLPGRDVGKAFESCDCNAALDRALANLEVAVKESGAAVARNELPFVNADAGQIA